MPIIYYLFNYYIKYIICVSFLSDWRVLKKGVVILAEIKEKIMICLSPDVAKKLKEASVEDCRSVSNMVEFILKKYFKN